MKRLFQSTLCFGLAASLILNAAFSSAHPALSFSPRGNTWIAQSTGFQAVPPAPSTFAGELGRAPHAHLTRFFKRLVSQRANHPVNFLRYAKDAGRTLLVAAVSLGSLAAQTGSVRSAESTFPGKAPMSITTMDSPDLARPNSNKSLTIQEILLSLSLAAGALFQRSIKRGSKEDEISKDSLKKMRAAGRADWEAIGIKDSDATAIMNAMASDTNIKRWTEICPLLQPSMGFTRPTSFVKNIFKKVHRLTVEHPDPIRFAQPGVLSYGHLPGFNRLGPLMHQESVVPWRPEPEISSTPKWLKLGIQVSLENVGQGTVVSINSGAGTITIQFDAKRGNAKTTYHVAQIISKLSKFEGQLVSKQVSGRRKKVPVVTPATVREGSGWLKVTGSGDRKFRDEVSVALVEQKIAKEEAAQISDTLMRMYEASLRWRSELFTAKDVDAITHGRVFDVKSFVKKLQAQNEGYVKAKISSENIRVMLFKRLVPFRHFKALSGTYATFAIVRIFARDEKSIEASEQEAEERQTLIKDLIEAGWSEKESRIIAHEHRSVMDWWRPRQSMRSKLMKEIKASKKAATRFVVRSQSPENHTAAMIAAVRKLPTRPSQSFIAEMLERPYDRLVPLFRKANLPVGILKSLKPFGAGSLRVRAQVLLLLFVLPPILSCLGLLGIVCTASGQEIPAPNPGQSSPISARNSISVSPIRPLDESKKDIKFLGSKKERPYAELKGAIDRLATDGIGAVQAIADKPDYTPDFLTDLYDNSRARDVLVRVLQKMDSPEDTERAHRVAYLFLPAPLPILFQVLEKHFAAMVQVPPDQPSRVKDLGKVMEVLGYGAATREATCQLHLIALNRGERKLVFETRKAFATTLAKRNEVMTKRFVKEVTQILSTALLIEGWKADEAIETMLLAPRDIAKSELQKAQDRLEGEIQNSATPSPILKNRLERIRKGLVELDPLHATPAEPNTPVVLRQAA